MTIEIAVRTATDVVFAADSKLTTTAFTGFDSKHRPQFLTQTYDNATKLTHDQDKAFIACIAGNASLGEISALHYLSQCSGCGNVSSEAGQDRYFTQLAYEMGKLRFDFWSELEIPPSNWPGTVVLIATISPVNRRPRLWRLEYEGSQCSAMPILENPSVFLEGSYREVFSLLYGFDPEVLSQTGRSRRAIEKALGNPALIKPINRFNVSAMPTQDAMDLACFLAGVQIEMDRFLPGTPKCGWPVDLMLLQGTPFRDIKVFSGKQLTHPRQALR